jgi:hypothetical protein
MTKELLEKRLAELTEVEKQRWALLNACLGAQQEVLYWLEKLSGAAEQPVPSDQSDK